jgi:hypothetical protein
MALWGAAAYQYLNGTYNSAIFDFTSIQASFNTTSGAPTIGRGNAMHVFTVTDTLANYPTDMTAATKAILNAAP